MHAWHAKPPAHANIDMAYVGACIVPLSGLSNTENHKKQIPRERGLLIPELSRKLQTYDMPLGRDITGLRTMA